MNPGFRIELRRSNALPLAAAVVAVMVLVDVVIGYRSSWAGNWMKMVTDQRSSLVVLAGAFAVGAGAMQAGLDQRRGVVELLGSVPRPRRTRALPVALALGLAAATAYLITFGIASLYVAPYASYADPAAIAGVVGVGAVTMIAAAWLGLLIGALVPSRLTPPIASVLTLMIMAVGSEGLGSLGNGAALALLLPDLSASVEGAAHVPVRVSALQGVWLLAVGASALGAFLAARRRFKILAALPAALALVLVAPQLPPGKGYMAAYTIDPRAAELVCATGTPRVCVTRADAARLPQVTAPARAALAALARLPHAPTAVIEHPELEGFTSAPPPPSRADTVWMDLTPYSADARGRLEAEDVADLTAMLLTNVGVSADCPRGRGNPAGYAASEISTAWLLGRPPTPDSRMSAEYQQLARTGWTALTSAPAAEQRRRVAAMRQALLTCTGDVYRILTKGGAR
jgi:hypothetical protein